MRTERRALETRMPDVVRGEVPTLDPLDDIDELPEEVLAATGLDGLVSPRAGDDDGFTPESLLGEDRDGRWAAREGEDDRGLDRMY